MTPAALLFLQNCTTSAGLAAAGCGSINVCAAFFATTFKVDRTERRGPAKHSLQGPVPPSSTCCCLWRLPRSEMFGEEGGSGKNMSELSKMASPSPSCMGGTGAGMFGVWSCASCSMMARKEPQMAGRICGGTPTGGAWVPLQVQHVAPGVRPSKWAHLHLPE